MKFTALEHKEQLSRSFLMLFAIMKPFRLPVLYLRGLWSPLYVRSHSPGRIKGSLRNSSLIPWIPDKHPKQGAQHLPPHRGSVSLCPGPSPSTILAAGASGPQEAALTGTGSCWSSTTAPRCFETSARTSNPVKKQHVTLFILLEVSASHPNLLSWHAQMGPGQYLTCHQCSCSTFPLATGLEHFPSAVMPLLWHWSVLHFTWQ